MAVFYKGENKHYLFNKDEAGAKIKFGSVLSDCEEITVLSNVFSGGESPFLYCMNHNTKSFYEKNPNAVILKKIFEWFAVHFEVIYPEQPIRDTALLYESMTLKKYADYLNFFKTGMVDIEKKEVSEDFVKSNLSVIDRAKRERKRS